MKQRKKNKKIRSIFLLPYILEQPAVPDAVVAQLAGHFGLGHREGKVVLLVEYLLPKQELMIPLALPSLIVGIVGFGNAFKFKSQTCI